MTWTSDHCYLAGLEHFTRCVNLLAADDWSRPSPCAGWTALDVLGHVGGTTRFGIDLLAGREPVMPSTEQPGSSVEGDPVAWWESLSGQAAAAVSTADLTEVHESPMGPRTIAEGLRFPAIDLFVHGWDLAAAAGHHVDIPAEVIAFTREALAGFPDAMVRSPRVFGPAREVPVDASAVDAFLAWTGRDPAWTPPR